MATILSISPPKSPLLHQHRRRRPCSPLNPYLTLSKPPNTTTLCFATPLPTPPPTVAQDNPPPPSEAELSPGPGATATSVNVEDPNFRGCKTCGRVEVERGCNGEGRIQGGIATVPGFGWWPIKAYRPCPGFVASGGRYRRRGQSMDEVAFGRSEREAPTKSSTKSSKKKLGPEILKG